MKQVSSLRVGKGFKKTEIGEIPADWEVAELIEVCEKPEYGYTSRSVTKPFGPKLLRITDIQSGNVNWNSVPFCDCPDDIRERYRLRDGDIVFARTGASTGKSFLLQKCPDAIFASYLIKVTGTKIEPLFLYMYFNSYSYWKQIQQLTVGSAQGGLNANKLSHLKVPFPPIAEQRKIGEILSIVDDAFHKLSEVIEKTKLLKKGTMRRLLTQGIGHTKLRMTAIGKIPLEWELARVADVCAKPEYGYTASASSIPVGPKLLRITDIQNRQVRWENVPYCSCSESERRRYSLKEGDIVFARTGASTGKSFHISNCPDAVFASYLIRISARDIDPRFLYLFFQSSSYWKQVQQLMVGSAQGGLNASEFSRIKLPLPSIAEQRAISATFSVIDEELDQAFKYLAKIGKLKEGLMRALLTGRVRVKV